MKKTVLFTLIIILFITNIASASGSWEGFYVAEETGSGQTSNQGNSNNNSGNSNSNNNKTPPKNNSGGAGNSGSNNSSNSSSNSNKSVKIGRLSAFSKTPHHTVIPSSTNKKINQNTKNFLSNPNSTAQSYVVGNYSYTIGDLNNVTDYSLWKVIKGEHRQNIQRTDSKKTSSAWRSKHFDWSVTGGNAHFSTPTKSAGNTITFLTPGTYKIRAVETLGRDEFEQATARVRVIASHNGAILRDYTETGEKIKTGTSTSQGKVTNWTLVIGPEDVGKPISVDKNTGGGSGGNGGSNKVEEIEFEVELVE